MITQALFETPTTEMIDKFVSTVPIQVRSMNGKVTVFNEDGEKIGGFYVPRGFQLDRFAAALHHEDMEGHSSKFISEPNAGFGFKFFRIEIKHNLLDLVVRAYQLDFEMEVRSVVYRERDGDGPKGNA